MNQALTRALPSAISGVRLALAPLLAVLLLSGAHRAGAAVLAFGAATDVADGALARRLGVACAAGAWLDVWADFLLVTAGLSALAARGVLPGWLVAVPVAVFAAFLATSGCLRPVYDPVGKAYGGVLMGSLLVSLLVPDAAVHGVLLLAVGAISGLVLSGRIRLALGRASRI